MTAPAVRQHQFAMFVAHDLTDEAALAIARGETPWEPNEGEGVWTLGPLCRLCWVSRGDLDVISPCQGAPPPKITGMSDRPTARRMDRAARRREARALAKRITQETG